MTVRPTLGAATIVAGNWSFTTLALTDGSHSFTAKATDNAGNITTTAAVTATVDTTAPSETISARSAPTPARPRRSASGGLTKDNTLALSGTVSDTNGVSSVQCLTVRPTSVRRRSLPATGASPPRR